MLMVGAAQRRRGVLRRRPPSVRRAAADEAQRRGRRKHDYGPMSLNSSLYSQLPAYSCEKHEQVVLLQRASIVQVRVRPVQDREVVSPGSGPRHHRLLEQPGDRVAEAEDVQQFVPAR